VDAEHRCEPLNRIAEHRSVSCGSHDEEEALRYFRLRLAVPRIVRFSEHFHEDGPTFLRRSCLLGVEGVVSMRRDAPIDPGAPSKWLKVKCFPAPGVRHRWLCAFYNRC
jgi:ATP-dependent DNA ligase